MQEKIVITGMGTLNPLGLSVKETWENVLNGVSGVGPITLFDSSRLQVRFVCEVKDFRPENYMEPKEARRRDRYQQLAAAAVKAAIAQAGLVVQEDERGRIGVVMSSAVGGIGTMAEMFSTLQNHGRAVLAHFPYQC
jgi:3-oxoacyl-[acyl-carrier-protein] synthase II